MGFIFMIFSHFQLFFFPFTHKPIGSIDDLLLLGKVNPAKPPRSCQRCFDVGDESPGEEVNPRGDLCSPQRSAEGGGGSCCILLLLAASDELIPAATNQSARINVASMSNSERTSDRRIFFFFKGQKRSIAREEM